MFQTIVSMDEARGGGTSAFSRMKSNAERIIESSVISWATCITKGSGSIVGVHRHWVEFVRCSMLDFSKSVRLR